MKAVNLEKLLPSDIPPGERVLWFGRPDPKSLWRKAYRADWVVIWFVAVAAWSFGSTLVDNGTSEALFAMLGTLGLGAAALAILGLLAWAAARSTLYVVTERRLVIKTGIALQIFINLPFSSIGAANVRIFKDGTGDVSTSMVRGRSVSYIALWPSARPFRFADPEPTLRCVADARAVAELLGRALAAASEQTPAKPTEAEAEVANMELPALA